MAATAAPEVLPRVDVPPVAGSVDALVHTASALPPDLSYCLDEEVQAGALGSDERAYVDLFMPDAVQWFDAVADEGDAFVGRVGERFRAWREGAAPVDLMALDWTGLGGLRWLLDECASEVVAALGEKWCDPPSQDEIEAVLPSLPGPSRLAARAATLAARCEADIARWGVDGFLAARGRTAALYEHRREALGRRDALIRDRVGARRRSSSL